jgi:pyruvate/2-oxoacid:ferredoxin oxidoreductase beta subunit
MSDVLQKAHAFVGTSFVEIYQNCIVYNEDVFASFTDRKNAANTQLHVRHGEPMLFGDNSDMGIRFDPVNRSAVPGRSGRHLSTAFCQLRGGVLCTSPLGHATHEERQRLHQGTE